MRLEAPLVDQEYRDIYEKRKNLFLGIEKGRKVQMTLDGQAEDVQAVLAALQAQGWEPL